MEFDYLKIFFSIFSGILLLILKEAYQKAQKQKLIANKLNAYLRYWKSYIFDNEGWTKVYEFGILCNLLEAKSESLEDFNAMRTKIKEEIKNYATQENLDDFQKSLKKVIVKNNIDNIIKDINEMSQNVLSGKTYISDEEASYLDGNISSSIITLKLTGIETLESFKSLFTYISSDDYSLFDNSQDFENFIWKITLLSKKIHLLFQQCEILENQNIFILTYKNCKA